MQALLGACVSFASVNSLTRQNTVDGFVGRSHIIWPHSIDILLEIKLSEIAKQGYTNVI